MALRFVKYEGLGNDFLVLDAERAGVEVTPELARRLCDRHRGVGADGVLDTGARGGRPSMRVINADGTTPEMCGNGIRCVALALAPDMGHGPYTIGTDAGPHEIEVVSRDGHGAMVRVEMVAPSLAPADVGLDADAPWIDERVEVVGRVVSLTAVSMGNPHAVTFDDVGDARAELGPAIEKDPRFAAGANVGFARVTDTGLELAVWERGVGWTQACGTGACAAAVAAVETARAERGAAIEVRLPGGALSIVVGEPGDRVRMTGPARRVFEGQISVRRFLAG